MRVGMRQGSASSASATATPNAAEMNKRACSFHSRASSFSSFGPRRFEVESLNLDLFNRQSHLTGAAGECFLALSLPQPDFIVVKGGAAERRDRIGVGQ